jgi:multidrug efflux pump subunit AcrB
VKKFVAEHPKPVNATKEEKRAYYKQYNEAVKQAARDAGSRRMVPIFLTTATTAVGVVPMIIAQSSFWMPVGVTIFAGGIGSLIMVVTMLPVVYWKVSLK